MDIKILENAIREIERNIKILENSKFEKERALVTSGRQVKLGLLSDDLKLLFKLEDLASVEKFVRSNKFSNVVRLFGFNGGFIILK